MTSQMRETYEFRIREERADRLFEPHEGTPLGSIRLIRLDASDPRVSEVRRLQRELRAEEKAPFFYGSQIIRRYSRKELKAARLLFVELNSAFEPTGEECGTEYDESTACPVCGADARQMSRLRLDVSKIPSSRELTRTIADEIVVSQRIADVMIRAGAPPNAFGPIVTRRDVVSDAWRQLLPPPSLDIAPQSKFGNGIFATDEESAQYRCPLGHTLGLNRLSEVHVVASTVKGQALASSSQFVGVRRGLLRPSRLLFVSPVVWEALARERLRSVNFEVVHLH